MHGEQAATWTELRATRFALEGSALGLPVGFEAPSGERLESPSFPLAARYRVTRGALWARVAGLAPTVRPYHGGHAGGHKCQPAMHDTTKRRKTPVFGVRDTRN